MATIDPKQTSCFFHQVADSSFGVGDEFKDGVPQGLNQEAGIWCYLPRIGFRESGE